MPALSPWPLWSQRNDWTADGRPDENATNNCGPESVAECLKYLTGIELPADFIKDVMYGESHLGYTDVQHMVTFLQQKCEVPCEVHGGDASSLLQPVVRQSITKGYPIIVLYFWKLDNPNSGHFSPVISFDEQGCTRANVWNGQLEYWNWNTFERWQKLGVCVVLKRTRSPELPSATPALPPAVLVPAPATTPRPGLSPAPAPAGVVRSGEPGDPLIKRMQALLVEAQPYVKRVRG